MPYETKAKKTWGIEIFLCDKVRMSCQSSQDIKLDIDNRAFSNCKRPDHRLPLLPYSSQLPIWIQRLVHFLQPHATEAVVLSEEVSSL